MEIKFLYCYLFWYHAVWIPVPSQSILCSLKTHSFHVAFQYSFVAYDPYHFVNDKDIDPEAFNANSGTRNEAVMPSYILGLNIQF